MIVTLYCDDKNRLYLTGDRGLLLYKIHNNNSIKWFVNKLKIENMQAENIQSINTIENLKNNFN